MKEIVVNRCFGGFSLSKKAYEFLGIPWDGYGHVYDIPRDDPQLVKCVHELGREADGLYARLEVVSIPDDVEWEIENYDGQERVSEKHRIW